MPTFTQEEAINRLRVVAGEEPEVQRLLDEVSDSGVCRRYISERSAVRRTRDGMGAFRNTEPWHALGERGMTVWQILMWAAVYADAEHRAAYIAAAELTARSTPYLWHNDTEAIAVSAPLPVHTIAPDVAPAPLMFWSFETARADETGHGCNWMLVVARADDLVLLWDEATTDPSDFGNLERLIVPYGRTWPHDFAEEQIETVGIVLKLCAFLRAPFVEVVKGRMPRPLRRELQRAGAPPEEVEETASVVTLRRRVIAKGADSGPVNGAVAWQHQWWVGGHYRAQWYPSLKAHKVIYVSPYLKGPEGKPLLDKVYDVVR